MSKKDNNGIKKSFGEVISGVGQKIKELFSYVVKHWSKAPEGKALSFKEMAAYCVGGMGVSAAMVLPTYLTAAVGIYIAAALNFDAASIAIIVASTSIFTIIKSPILGMLIDNTKSKYGKFRPYIMLMPIPSFICICLIGWLPYYIGQVDYVAMIVIFAILFNILQVFMGLYTTAFSSLIQVISPSPEERTGLMSIGSVVYSLGPSVIGIFLPLLAKLFSTIGADGKPSSGLNAIGTYQWIIPAMALVFFALGYWTAFGTKERVVVSKKYVQKLKFFDGLKQTIHNKYFWISASSAILGVFRLICTSFTAWICIYMLHEEATLSLANTILGMAYVPGMLLAPLLIKKLGKKNLVLFSNGLLLVMTCFMFLLVKEPIVLLVVTFFAIISNSVQVVTGPAMVAQYYDYQQFKTGRRIEGFMSQFSAMILSTFAIFTAFVGPAISASFGYTNDNNILYDNDILTNIMRLNFVVGAISIILGTIPYFFWDLTEKRHRQIMEILTVRAKSEDGEIPEDAVLSLEERITQGEDDVLKNYLSLAVNALPSEPVGDIGLFEVSNSVDENDDK